MRAWVAGLCLVLACIEDKLVPCGDELCPRGTICRSLTNPDEGFCATSEQVAACTGVDEAAPCDGGWCHDGVCLPITCGNARVDLGEACDDGNTVTGDGVCSGDCASDETCGNGSVDPIRMVGGTKDVNEQCDDGNLASGDGCSSSCQNETALWSFIDTRPIPALGAAQAVLDSVRGRIVLFGGRESDDSGNRATFEWDGSTWSRISSVSSPLARTAFSMAFDAARRRVVLFGGFFQNNDTPFGDTWTWDGRNWRNESPTTVPGSRLGAAMAYDAARERIVLFGGATSSTTLADTWEWDGTNWTRITVAASPSPRAHAAMTYDAKRGRIVMVGGYAAAAIHETWEYDGTTWTLSSATTPTDIYNTGMLTFDGSHVVAYGYPSGTVYTYDGTTWTPRSAGALTPRQLAVLVGDPRGSRLLVFGGAIGTNMLDETWVYSNGSWQEQLPAVAPTARAGMATAFDERRGVSWMFGGDQTNGVFTDEMWAFDGVSRWRNATASGPSGRSGAAMAYDRVNDRVVMFGGAGPSFAFAPAETWLWNGTAWTLATPAHSPPPRALASMAYDPRRNRVVLVGGIGPGMTPTLQSLGDIWEWDGVDWTEVPETTANPSDRYGAAVTYDEAHEELLLLHGAQVFESTFRIYNDMWSFDGTTWTQSATPLPSRGAGTFFYERTRRVAIAFAGGNEMSDYDDTWEWNGATWQRLNVVPPPARARHATFPAHGGGFVVFSGMQSFSFLDDTWRLSYANDEARELCVSSTLDNDGDGLAGCADDDCWSRCSPYCAPGSACPADALRCGDGMCNAALEDCRLCPDDCGACMAACGDAACDAPETSASCPGDCQ